MKLILAYAAIYGATVLLCLAVRDALPGPAGAVIIGILIGLVSAVPTSLLLVLALRRRQSAAQSATPSSEEVQP